MRSRKSCQASGAVEEASAFPSIVAGSECPAVEISGLAGFWGGWRGEVKVAPDGPTTRRFSVLSESESPRVMDVWSYGSRRNRTSKMGILPFRIVLVFCVCVFLLISTKS
jgi:hypothetical protein